MRWLLVVVFSVAVLAAPVLADWGDPVKWDQLTPTDQYGAASWIDNDTPSDAISADDFQCTQTGFINEIDFNGFSLYGIEYLNQLRITFWTDVPATPGDASHPGTLLHEAVVSEANPNDPLHIGWYRPDPVNQPNYFKIDLPQNLWFPQQGSPQNPVIYWIAIQGVMIDDGFFDAFYWFFRERHTASWGDDAAIASSYFGYEPWANWGSPPNYGNPAVYTGSLPAGWTSLDLSFRLSGTPEPTALLLLGLGTLFVRRR